VDVVTLQQLAVALGLGLLLGLERERKESSIAGIRTFPLIALFGTVCAQLGQAFGGWIVAAGLLALAAVVIFANHVKTKAGDIDPGMTTEIAALLLYVLGALLVAGHMSAAIVLGGVMAVILHMKGPMHNFAAAVGEKDMRAIMQFVVLTLIILPVLPNRDFGPYGVWNPFKIWLMVVLIVGISLGGYVAYKLFGAKAGTLLGGVIGGLISSTATTVSYARRCAAKATLAPLAALVIMIASCLSLARVLVEIAAVAPKSLPEMAPPIAALLVVCILVSAALYFLAPRNNAQMPEQKNPAEIKSAFVFTGLYAGVLLAVAVAKEFFGSAGLYVVAVISGLTDMDAITLSTARLAETGGVDKGTAWRAIIVAAMANFVFKLGVVASLAKGALTARVAAAFAIALASGAAIIFLWPA
jgi:uncharacterized membrane protein (DUF4010 family)